MPNIMLCADSLSTQYPESLGLEGEQLQAQDWLHVLCTGQEARIQLREHKSQEVWVAGSNDIDAINLAAALKHDGAKKVCLVSFNTSGSLFSRAQSAGIDEVWDKPTFLEHYMQEKGTHGKVSPVGQLQRVSTHSNASKQGSKEKGYLLSVVGAGGGIGKSSISVIAAYLAQSKGYRTALVDADLQFGDLAYLTGHEGALAIDEAIRVPGRLEKLECKDRIPAILSAPERLEYAEELASEMPKLIEDVRSRFEVVVVNTSPAWADIHLQLLEAGGNALFILDQRPSSLWACKHALQLCARCGVATQPIVFALNRCSRQSLFSSIDVSCALQGAHVVELSEGGRDVEELLGTGAPLELVDSGNALCQSLARVLEDLLPKPAQGKAAIVSMPSKKRFSLGGRRKKAACL